MAIAQAGAIRDLPNTVDDTSADRELAEAILLSLANSSLIPPASPPHRFLSNAPPPLPPRDIRPEPPVERPTARARLDIRGLPIFLPPLGPRWNNGLVAREMNRTPPPRRRRWSPRNAERFDYFPARHAGYGPLRRNTLPARLMTWEIPKRTKPTSKMPRRPFRQRRVATSPSLRVLCKDANRPV